MAKYKPIDTQPRLIAVDLSRQLVPGTFEHALNHLLDHDVDLSHFDARFRNEATGAPAYPPALLLQVVPFAYVQGIVSSRAIERACQEHVPFTALCGDQAPPFATIARLVRTLGDGITKVLAGVLAVCDAEGLIGREMFTIDGVELPSNASKRRSGTRADFERQARKLEAAARTMLQRHRATDTESTEPPLSTKAAKRLERLQRDAPQMRGWLAQNPDERRGAKGAIRQSNRTDNESAKPATSKGVIQGYTGVATVDAAHQSILDGQARSTISRRAAGPRSLSSSQPMFATARHDARAECRVWTRPRGRRAVTHRADATTHRHGRRSSAIRATLRDRRTGVCESAPQRATRSLHAPRSWQSRRAMEAVLPVGQHRNAGTPEIRGIAAGCRRAPGSNSPNATAISCVLCMARE